MKVNITLDDDLMKRLDEYADRTYMTRSGLVSLAVTQYLNANDMVLAVQDMALSLRKIADQGLVDDDLLNELKDFERFSKLFVQCNKSVVV